MVDSKFARCAGCKAEQVTHHDAVASFAFHSPFADGVAIDFALYRIDAA